MKPVVAIVGRPNVGKSTLFNRLIGARHAIVEDEPGVTRDRLYRDATWLDRDFVVIDTGGIDFVDKDNVINTKVRDQAAIAIEEADVIVFVVDSRAGMVREDEDVANMLRKSGKPVVVCVNKMDNFARVHDVIYDFYSLGLGEPIAVSSLHGMNTGDLLDEVIANFPDTTGNDHDEDILSIAVIGRPNVGKSSLVNKIIGENRSIVADMAGTTRDAIDSYFKWNGDEYRIIDTAGMRRRSKIGETTERYSVARALRAVDRSDVVLLVIDATEGVTEQDKKIGGYAHEEGKAIIVVINKWDLVPKNTQTMKDFETELDDELAYMPYAVRVYVSALTGQRLGKIMEMVTYVAEQHQRRIPATRINEVLLEATLLNPPPSDKGKRLKVYYGTQVGIKPPTFVIFVNDIELMHFSYLRYLENQLRDNFMLKGTPIKMKVRGKKQKDIDKGR